MSILNIVIFYLKILAIGTFIILLLKRFPEQTKLFLTAFLAIFIIYKITTPTLKYKPWIIPDDVTEGPPIQLYYPGSSFSLTPTKKAQKRPDLTISY